MFRKALLTCCLLSLTLSLSAQEIVRFRLSRPYCLLNFLNTAKGDAMGASAGLVSFIKKKGLQEDPAFSRLLSAYAAIPLEYTYSREQFPERRLRSRYGRISDLLVVAAVHAEDLEGFGQRIIGLLPNTDHRALMRVLHEAMPYYDSLVWKPYSAELEAGLARLKTYEPRINALFRKLNHFYRGAWPEDIPFTVSLYPVPGGRGTAATPHVNTLCVGMRTGTQDYDGLAGVVLHEMCHSLYNEQPAEVQAEMERYFTGDSSWYSGPAYSFFDEGLATACGNGWAREQFNGRPDPKEWYNDKYIDGFGHGLYPLVKQYLADGKQIDSAFVAQSIAIFRERFPRAPYDYDLLLGNIHLYSDAVSAEERKALHAALNRHFRVYSYNASSPILDNTSLELLSGSDGTQLIVVQRHEAENMAKLSTLFPEVAGAMNGRQDAGFIMAFYDRARRPVIIIRAPDHKQLERAFSRLRKEAYLDKKIFYQAL